MGSRESPLSDSMLSEESDSSSKSKNQNENSFSNSETIPNSDSNSNLNSSVSNEQNSTFTPPNVNHKPGRKKKFNREVESLLTFNAVLENSFPKTPKNRETRRSRNEELDPVQNSEFLSSLNIKRRKIPRSIITRPNNVGGERLVVFIDPCNDNVEFWHPAMVVPTVEWDSEMKKVKPGECIVRDFSDLSFRVVLVQDLCICREDIEPFLTFKKTSEEFLKHKGVQAAIQFLQHGIVPNGFKWEKWGESDEFLLDSEESEVEEVRKKRPYKRREKEKDPNEEDKKGEKNQITRTRSYKRKIQIESDDSSLEESSSALSSEDDSDHNPENSKEKPINVEISDEKHQSILNLTKEQFEEKLMDFMQKKGNPISKTPVLGYEPLDLKRLYEIVTSKGGMDEVTRKQEWRRVYQDMKIANMSTSAAYSIRNNYHRYLFPFEEAHFSQRLSPAKNNSKEEQPDEENNDKDKSPSKKTSEENLVKEEKKEKESKDKQTNNHEDSMDIDTPGEPTSDKKRSTKRFNIEDRVMVLSKDGNRYPAKILDYTSAEVFAQKARGKTEGRRFEGKYFIHYLGWKSAYDEWVPEHYASEMTEKDLNSIKKRTKRHKRVSTSDSNSNQNNSSPTQKSNQKSSRLSLDEIYSRKITEHESSSKFKSHSDSESKGDSKSSTNRSRRLFARKSKMHDKESESEEEEEEIRHVHRRRGRPRVIRKSHETDSQSDESESSSSSDSENEKKLMEFDLDNENEENNRRGRGRGKGVLSRAKSLDLGENRNESKNLKSNQSRVENEEKEKVQAKEEKEKEKEKGDKRVQLKGGSEDLGNKKVKGDETSKNENESDAQHKSSLMNQTENNTDQKEAGNSKGNQDQPKNQKSKSSEQKKNQTKNKMSSDSEMEDESSEVSMESESEMDKTREMDQTNSEQNLNTCKKTTDGIDFQMSAVEIKNDPSKINKLIEESLEKVPAKQLRPTLKKGAEPKSQENNQNENKDGVNSGPNQSPKMKADPRKRRKLDSTQKLLLDKKNRIKREEFLKNLESDSIDEGNLSEASISSNHSSRSQRFLFGISDSGLGRNDDHCKSDLRIEKDSFKELCHQVQLLKQKLPDSCIDFSQLFPGFADLSSEHRAEKIEARMNVLKAQYRQLLNDLKKNTKQHN